MKRLSTAHAQFKKEFKNLLDRNLDESASVEKIVRDVIESVRRQGDQALRSLTQKFDKHIPKKLEVSREEIQAAYRQVDRADIRSLKIAAQRIEAFHREQFRRLPRSWRSRKDDVTLGEEIGPLERVGIYVPGGQAAYPSTVFMNSIPARVAGVREIVMVSPWMNGEVNPYTLVAADLAGMDRIFKIGGAQAVAALALGTASVPCVDKIVGPGNIYVATAKRLVFGLVGIDMIAGPTEVVILADESACADHVAIDLLSQAEHDPRALAVLVTTSRELVSEVERSLDLQLASLPRRKILEQALKNRGLSILTKTLDEACEIANQLASEHLEIHTKLPRSVAKKIRSAGAIFVGSGSPVAFGDYLAGPNHVLPTSGTARFSSPLGVGDFLKRSSFIEASPRALKKFGPHVVRLASLEGLTAHAASIALRLE